MDPRTEKMLAERAQKVAATPAPLRGPSAAVQDARRWAKKNGSAAKFLAGALVVVLIAAYYLFVTLPAQRADQVELKARAAETLKADITSKHDAVADCLSKVKADADEQWTAACKALRQGPDCPLPEKQADAFQLAERNARNACLLSK